jgi:hypothetical protein
MTKINLRKRIRFYLLPITQSEGDMAMRVVAHLCHWYCVPREVYERLWRNCRELNRYVMTNDESIREPILGSVEAEERESVLTADDAELLAEEIVSTLQRHDFSAKDIEAFMAANRIRAGERAIRQRLESESPPDLDDAGLIRQ